MRNITIKKIICLITALFMSLSLSIPAFAEERARIEIIVDDETDIVDFYRSAEYDPDNAYSFLIKNDIQTRILCPNCGNNNYRGFTEHREMNIHLRQCPFPDPGTDHCVEYHVYTYSKCDYYGYQTTTMYQYIYWIVYCHVEMPGDLGTYIARPGQSYLDGYDFHEDPVYMQLMQYKYTTGIHNKDSRNRKL